MTSPEYGKWFFRVGYYLLPFSGFAMPKKAEAELERTREALDALKREEMRAVPTRKGRSTRASEGEALAETDFLVKKVKALIAHQEAFYRAQPKWNLANVSCRSSAEAVAVAKEFLRMAKEASGEYCWLFNQPPDHEDWELHGWKHVCYEDLLELSEEAKRSWVPEIRVDAAVGSRNAENLFKRAIAKEPEAVAIINLLLPSEKERLSAARNMCSSDVTEADICKIPSPIDLGVALLEIIMNKPTSPEADVARRRLQQLTSRKLLTRGSRGKGRPRENHHPETVRCVYIMANSLLRQVRQVDALFQTQIQDPIQMQELIAQYYPWLIKARVYSKDRKSDSILNMQPSEGALHVAAVPLGLSPSKVEKLVLRKRAS